LARIGPDRPIIVVGVEQGGGLASRLLNDVIAPDPTLKRRLVGAYLIETVVTDPTAVPVCAARAQAGCLVAWKSVAKTDFIQPGRLRSRSRVWNGAGRLVPLGNRPIVCVNPLLGARSEAEAPERLNLGAVNATGLEAGARPAFMVRQASAQCVDGLLRLGRPRSASLMPSGGWAERLRVPGYNLFWADLEADALARSAAWRGR